MKLEHQEEYIEKHAAVTCLILDICQYIGDVPLPDKATYADLGTLQSIHQSTQEVYQKLESWLNNAKQWQKESEERLLDELTEIAED